jgi:hypothetical protein
MAENGQVGYVAVGHFLSPDAEFIAHAREDIPALLAALEEAERQRRLSQSGWAEALQDRGRIAAALEEAERERDEWKRLFSECHPVHLDGVRRAYEAEREVERLKAEQPPCDGGCNYNSGPEETCSAHGRPVAEVWDIVEYVARQRDEAERRIAAVEALLTENDVPRGVTFDGTPFPQIALASDVRAALHPVAETTEKGNDDE